MPKGPGCTFSPHVRIEELPGSTVPYSAKGNRTWQTRHSLLYTGTWLLVVIPSFTGYLVGMPTLLPPSPLPLWPLQPSFSKVSFHIPLPRSITQAQALSPARAPGGPDTLKDPAQRRVSAPASVAHCLRVAPWTERLPADSQSGHMPGATDSSQEAGVQKAANYFVKAALEPPSRVNFWEALNAETGKQRRKLELN